MLEIKGPIQALTLLYRALVQGILHVIKGAFLILTWLVRSLHRGMGMAVGYLRRPVLSSGSLRMSRAAGPSVRPSVFSVSGASVSRRGGGATKDRIPAYGVPAVIAVLGLLSMAMLSMDEPSGIDRNQLLSVTQEEMQKRRQLLGELSLQQDELHEILQARPSGFLSTVLNMESSNPGAVRRDQEPIQQLQAHLSANQRYLSDGLGVLRAIPHRWPVQGRVRLVNSHYGNRTSPFGTKKEYHGGTDLKARTGDSIVASAEGYVYRVGKHGGFGNMVHLIHPSGFETIYAHLSRIQVEKGQIVHPGEILGRAGDTGITTGPHLHYEVRLDGRRQNPIRYLIP